MSTGFCRTALLCAIAAVPLSAWQLPAAPGGPVTRAAQLIEAGRCSEAVAALDQAKQSSPENGDLYFYTGLALTQIGRLSDAALELREAVRLAPSRLEYKVLQANVEARLKQNVFATAALSPFHDPANVQRLDTAWLKLLADTDYRLEQFDDALKVLSVLGQRRPGDGAVDLDRGKILNVQAHPDLAIDAFRVSISKSSGNSEAYFELGKLLYQQNQLAQARQALTQALHNDSRNAEYLYKLAMVCLAEGDAQAASGYLQRALPAAEQKPEIYLALARADDDVGDHAKAKENREHFQAVMSSKRAAEERARTIDKYVAQGERKLDEGHAAEARALFERAALADSQRWDAHAYLAEMSLNSGDLVGASTHLAAMQRIDPESVVGAFLAARYWFRRGDYNRALSFAEKVKLSQPANPELRELLRNIYTHLGQQDRARDEHHATLSFAHSATPAKSAQ